VAPQDGRHRLAAVRTWTPLGPGYARIVYRRGRQSVLSMLTKERYDRQSLAKFGRSRMRLAVVDFGDVVIFGDEFGNVGKMTKDKVEVPGRWEEAACDVYTWLYTPREEARTSPT